MLVSLLAHGDTGVMMPLKTVNHVKIPVLLVTMILNVFLVTLLSSYIKNNVLKSAQMVCTVVLLITPVNHVTTTVSLVTEVPTTNVLLVKLQDS